MPWGDHNSSLLGEGGQRTVWVERVNVIAKGGIGLHPSKARMMYASPADTMLAQTLAL